MTTTLLEHWFALADNDRVIVSGRFGRT